jgi:hypothetical protein
MKSEIHELENKETIQKMGKSGKQTNWLNIPMTWMVKNKLRNVNDTRNNNSGT